MKKWIRLAILPALLLFCSLLLLPEAHAATEGYYTYSVSNGKATITDCDTAISGDITIPSTLGGYPVTAIGSQAFSQCKSLTGVEIPDSVKTIGDSAFSYCWSLTAIDIPESVTEIGASAFFHCKVLTDITIPESVTALDSYVFAYCQSLTHLEIPGSVTAIGEHAFYNCTSLERIAIPSGVTTIEGSTFRDCSSLTEITIPASVVVIGENAFRGCTGFTEFTIPGGVTTIKKYAFGECTGLLRVTVPDNVTTMGSDVFRECTALTEVTLGKGITSISGYAFWGCTALKEITIPTGFTSIGNYAFTSCTSMTRVTIPASVTTIGNGAFRSCTALTEINIEDLTAWLNIAFGTADSNPMQANIDKKLLINGQVVSELELPASITQLPEYAFYRCVSLNSVVVPGNVTTIGNNAFYGCSGLTKLTVLDGVTKIGSMAFQYCAALRDVSLSGSVATIGTRAFYGCKALTEMILPEGVTQIGTAAFCDCTALTDITIPGSVTAIGSSAFSRCSSLRYVKYADTMAQWEQISIGENNDPLQQAVLITTDNSVTQISIHTLPTKTEYVTGEALDTTGLVLKAVWTNKTETEVTEGFVVTGFDSNLIGQQTLTVTYEGKNTVFTVTVNRIPCGENLSWTLDDDGVLTISGTGKMTDFANSEAVPWYQLRDEVKKVVIEKGVTSIGKYAFSYCGNLAEITIPSGVLEIGGYAFERTHSLKQVKLPAGLQTMGSYLFYRSEGLQSIVIPDSVTSLGASAFSRCVNLQQVTIGAGITKLERYTFYTCASLTDITVPDSVTELGEQVFENCSGLTAITIGRHLTAIGQKSFSGCTALQNVYYRNTAAKWAEITVGGTNEPLFAATLHTREETVAAAIVGQPKDILVQVGDTANFTVIAEGDGLTYKWQYKNAGATAWNNTSLTGYNTSTLTLYNVQGAGYNGRQFRCIVTDANGNSVTSEPATLSVPYIVKQPATAFGTAVNSNHQFTVEYSISEGVTYQWQYKGNTASSEWANTSMSGAKTNTLTVPAIATRNGYKYRCIINDNGTQIITKEVTLYVQAAAATITKQPVAATAVCGDYATFTVEATGDGLSYQWQWYHEETGTWVDTRIAGYHTNTLKVKTNNYNGGRLYRCRLRTVDGSGWNEVFSESVQMTVLPAAEITQQPQSITVKVGENATFHVEAEGKGLTFQWQWAKFVGNWKNTTAAGNTTDTLTVSDVNKEMNGRYYRVIITNKYTGTVTTQYCQLFVE